MSKLSVLGAAGEIAARWNTEPELRLIGIAGIPGAGKSTLAAALDQLLPSSAIIPMDGYHLPRGRLDAEGLRRRGAPHTFDAAAFREDLARFREEGAGSFPAFDHAEQDPRPGAITITQWQSPIIVEGLYLLLREWDVARFFDLSVFIDCDLEAALARVAARHVACGLCRSADEAQRRVETNDRLNALAILADGCRERADWVLRID